MLTFSLAALALATEKPTPELLKRHPEKRNSKLITFNMWKMIIGQCIFQITVNLLLFKLGGSLFKLDTSEKIEKLMLRTTVFNTFVFMQLSNELNCRFLGSELNVFKGITKNPIFLIIMAATIMLQIIIVQFGGVAFGTTAIPWYLWLSSVGIGLISLPIATIIRLIPDFRGHVEEERVFVSKPRLAWQGAIHDIKLELSVFSALRRGKTQLPSLKSLSNYSIGQE